MSRMIPGKPLRNEEDVSLRDTAEGKLVITDYKDHSFVCLFRNNRLLRVTVLSDSGSNVGCVFLGKIKRLLPSIGACFVEIAGGELVYLSLSELEDAFLVNRPKDGRLLEGDELLVQIMQDATKTKQATATMRISLAGRYVAFSVGSPKTGISGKLEEPKRKELLQMLKNHGLTTPDGKTVMDPSLSGILSYCAVLRTEAADASEERILEEYKCLHERFLKLFIQAKYRTCFSKLYSGASSCENAVAQITEEYGEAVTDLKEIYEGMLPYFQERNIPLRFYSYGSYPLNRLYSLKTRLEDALSRRVWLKSGAYLIIDNTEAMTVIDVNSGKYDAKKASEDAIYQINLEAAAEIALQMRLRNLSGMIIVDFINMKTARYQGELLRQMRQFVKDDRIQTNILDITSLGLMEITRKKVYKPLEEQLKAVRENKGKASKEKSTEASLETSKESSIEISKEISIETSIEAEG